MRSIHRFFVLAMTAVAATAGCENQEARRRAEISRDLEEYATALTSVTSGTVSAGTEAAADRQRNLTQILSRLGSLRDAQEGQETARSIMAASAHRELAAMALAEAGEIETQLNRDRTVIAAKLDAALRLQNLAAARRATDLGASHVQLADHRSAAESMRRDNSERMAELDGPIGELTDDNSRDRGEIDRLALEANRLRREAAQLGSADGFNRFEQAVGREREADRYEYRIAMREVDLDYQLVPEHDLAQIRFEGAQHRIAAIDRSEENLRRYAEATAEDADATRGHADGVVDEMTALVAEVDAYIDGEAAEVATLASLYEIALDHLDRAASEARTAAAAARGEAATPAKLAGARAQALRGRAYWSQAQGLTRHVELLDSVIEADALSGADIESFRARRDAIATLRDEALQAARAAYLEAESGLSGVSGSGAQAAILAFTNSVRLALAGLEGRTLDLPLSIGSGGGDGPAEAQPASSSDGPATHDAFIEMLVGLGPGEVTADFGRYVRMTTGAGRAFESASKRFEAALASQFGDDVAKGTVQGTAMGLGLPTQVRDVRLVQDDGDSAVYGSDSMLPNGEIEFTVRRFDDGWFIEFESLGGNKTEMTQALALMARAFNDITRRLEAGEFATVQELQPALLQAVQTAAGQ